MIFDNLWIEKYRPNTLKDLVLNSDIKAVFESYRKDETIPNIAFIGPPGVGKTTLAKVIVNDILGCQYLYLNASDESGIDTIRTKVVGFAQTKSIDGKIKVIILDEVDGLTIDAQRALRNTMEEFAQITRFVLTANYSYRVIPALQSRCQSYDLTPPIEGILARLKFILTSEKVQFTDKDVENIAREKYPDLRKAIATIQQYSKSKTLTIPKETEVTIFVDQIFKLLRAKHVLKLRKWIIENEIKFSSDYANLLRQLFNYVFEQKIEDDVKKKYLIIISEYLYRSSNVLDQEINFYTCMLQLNEI